MPKTYENPWLQVVLGVFLLVIVMSAFNLFVLPRHIFIDFQQWRTYDWFLLESIFCMLLGGMLLIGSGGLSYQTLKSAVDLSQTDATRASEIFRQSRFRTNGLFRLGLILIFCGIVLLALFLSSF